MRRRQRREGEVERVAHIRPVFVCWPIGIRKFNTDNGFYSLYGLIGYSFSVGAFTRYRNTTIHRTIKVITVIALYVQRENEVRIYDFCFFGFGLKIDIL